MARVTRPILAFAGNVQYQVSPMSTESIMAERKARWRQFLAGENPPRHLFWINSPPDGETRPLLWPENKRARIEWMLRDYERRVARLGWLADDSLLLLDMQTGTEIFAECFGCSVHRPDNDMPSARPCVTSAAAADKLKVPVLSSSPLAYLFEMADELRQRTGPAALVRLPDIQSPMDIAALIWEKSDFYVALITPPCCRPFWPPPQKQFPTSLTQRFAARRTPIGGVCLPHERARSADLPRGRHPGR